MSAITQRGAGAVDQPDEPAIAIVKMYFRQLSALLPSHVRAQSWYAGVHAALYKNAKLLEHANANPESLIFALYDAARQGLEPGTPAYYLTPRGNRRAKGGKEVLGIRGYMGEIELIYRAGAVSNVVVSVVRRGEHFRFKRGDMDYPDHEVEWGTRKKARGDIYLAYGYCKMRDGSYSHVVVLDEDDIERAKRASGTANYEGSTTFWNDPDDVEAMWLKTVVHRLQKFVPTSAEFVRVNAEVTANAKATAEVIGQHKAAELGAGQAAIAPPAATGSAAGQDERAPQDVIGVVAVEGAGGAADAEPLDPRQFAQPPAPEDAPIDAEVVPDVADQGGRAAAKPMPAAVELVTEFDPVPHKGDELPATKPQANAMEVMARKNAQVADEADRLALYSRIVGRTSPAKSMEEFTKPEASRVLDTLGKWQDDKILAEQCRAVIAAARDAVSV